MQLRFQKLKQKNKEVSCVSKLKELREAENIEQRDMAKIIGVSPASYSKKENGIIRCSLDEAKKIADFFHKSIEEIFYPEEVVE
ncbi:MAG: helix-turn-helix transcriptional regulator [Clostridia bacterium]|nr:helix-turn-helix transcriptional regulator [Clostridia bacterium]